MDFTKMTTKQIAKVVLTNKIAAKEMTAQNDLAYAELRKRGVKDVTVANLGMLTERAGYTSTTLVTALARKALEEVGRLTECQQTKEVAPQYVATLTQK